MSSKFELFKSPKDNLFYFHLKNSKGEIILQSEGYTTKANCQNGIRSVKKNAALDKAYQTNAKHFSLKSVDNGKIIASSEKYASEELAQKGMAAVKKNAPNAESIDLTVRKRTVKNK
jgi:uncharacterized protein